MGIRVMEFRSPAQNEPRSGLVHRSSVRLFQSPPSPPPKRKKFFFFPGFGFVVKIYLLESSKLDL